MPCLPLATSRLILQIHGSTDAIFADYREHFVLEDLHSVLDKMPWSIVYAYI